MQRPLVERVKPAQLLGGQIEARRVKAKAAHKAAAPVGVAVGLLARRVEEDRRVSPDLRRRRYAGRVNAVDEVLPEGGRAIGAGEEAAEADDCDRLHGTPFRAAALKPFYILLKLPAKLAISAKYRDSLPRLS